MFIGIDLGTLSCNAGFVNAENIPTLIGDSKSPSLFRTPNSAAASKDRCYIGRIANEYFLDGMTQSFFCRPKWELGSGNSLMRDMHGRAWTAEVLQALVFNKIRDDCMANGLGMVEGAVVAVPANFSNGQRNAVRTIGRLIEMPIVEIIDAPLAAARFLIDPTNVAQNILVCEFGFGSFEASVVRYSQSEIALLKSLGDRKLGTITVHEQLVKMIQSQIGAQSSLQSPLIQHHLSMLVEQSITDLCQSDSPVSSKSFVGGIPIDVFLSKVQLEGFAGPLGNQCAQKVRAWLDTIGLNLESFDRILLIGGGTLMPGVRSRFCEALKISEQSCTVAHPLEAVAYGAASFAFDSKARSLIVNGLTKEAPFDVGIRIQDPRTQETAIYKLVKRDAALPARGSKVFKTSRIDQDRMVIEVVQVRDSVRKAISLGNFSFGPLHPTTAHHPIEIAIKCDRSGTIEVSARDMLSGQQIQSHVRSLQTERSAAEGLDTNASNPELQELVNWGIANGQF